MPEATRPRVSLIVEQWGPGVMALTTAILLCVYSDYIVGKFKTEEWKVNELYAAIFDWAAIQTGFAFGVYGFVAGRRDGFVGALQGTIAMERFISYIKRANIAGFVLTVASIPLIIVSPPVDTSFSESFIVVVVWFSAFVWAFCAFLRLAYNFGRMASIRDTVLHRA